MVLARWQASITDLAGNVIPEASIEVRPGGGGALLSLFEDRAGAVPIGNPFTADSEGFAFFHSEGGPLRIRAYKAGWGERVWDYVPHGLAGEQDPIDQAANIEVDPAVGGDATVQDALESLEADKAEDADLDTLAGRVTTAEADIDAVPGLITAAFSTYAAGAAAFRAHKNGSSQTSITPGAETKLTFGTEAFDVGTFYDTSTSRWTPPAGIVRLTAAARFSANVVDQNDYVVSIYKNGSKIAEGLQKSSGTGLTEPLVTVTDQADGNDYYEAYCVGQGSGNKTVSGDATVTWFCGELVR